MNTVKIPQGDNTVTVELTVKELMALAGIRFHGNHRLEIEARKKLNHVLNETYALEQPIPYQMLT
ncbi:hypothetical protein SAMN05444162_0885 [Paenibacillaceae bacterium GAS479]|nr:hypothetical protein SAMN05444162_0885 [Paenibacillaceae bacterium GAS479]